MNQPVPISAVVLTFNEELNIDACLRSVHGWCHEILVLDSGSTDQTVDFCERYTDKIYSHPYVNHASQLDWALNNLPLSTEWVMPLDADHLVTELLKQQITDIMLHPDPTVDGYYARHQYYFRGVRMRGFKAHRLALFRIGKAYVDQSEMVDFRIVVQGKTQFLRGAVHEINHKEDAIDFWIDKHQKFSSRIAVEEVLRSSGILKWSPELRPRLLGNPNQRMLWFKNRWYRMPLYVRPALYFTYRYFFRMGILDGVSGFIYHFLHAFWFRLMVDIKIAELRRRFTRGELSLAQLAESLSHKF